MRPASIRLAAEVMDDLDRIVDHLRQHEADAIEARIEQIITALDVLADNPLIGRPAGDELRELIIGRDTRGYIALYHYLPVIDTVLVLAIRAQREAGYARS